MTLTNVNHSVLAWYTEEDHQQHRKSYAYGNTYPLIVPIDFLIPFQIIRPTKSVYNISVSLHVHGSEGPGTDVTDLLEDAGLIVKKYPVYGYDIIVFPGVNYMIGGFAEGPHYLTIDDGDTIHYSEIFTLVVDPCGYLKLEWGDFKDLVFQNGRISYEDPKYRNVIYLPTELGKPEYLFEEEGSNRDGVFFPLKQLSEKRYKFSFIAPEYLLDVMRLIRLSDYKRITSKGKIYDADHFLLTPEWSETGDLAEVSAEFDSNTIIKKTGQGLALMNGCDFNSDFSGICGGGSIDPIDCELPTAVNISGNPAVSAGSVVYYSLLKTGGNSLNAYNWIVTGGTIVGPSDGIGITVQWGDVAGNFEIRAAVSCLSGPNTGSIPAVLPVTVSLPCMAASSVSINGPANVSPGSTQIYSAEIIGGASNSVQWSVTGGTIQNSSNEYIVVVVWGSSPGVYTLTVEAKCGEVIRNANKNVEITNTACVNPTSVSIAGSASHAPGSQTYNASKVGGSSNVEYNWSVTGGTIVGPTTGPSVNVNWFSSGTITVYAGCPGSGGSVTNTLNVTVIGGCVLPSNLAITGPNNVAPNSTQVYGSNFTGGSGYSISWVVGSPTDPTPDGVIIGPNNAATVEVQWGPGTTPSHPGTAVLNLYAICGGGGGSFILKTLVVNLSGVSSSLYRIPAHPLPATNDTTDWSGFPDISLPTNVINVGGDGFGLWANETVNSAGKLSMLSKGWTNLYDIGAFARAKWGPGNIYSYSQCYYMANLAIQQCISEGLTGVVGGVDYGDMNAMFSGDLWNTNIPYYHATIAGAVEIGKRMNWGTSNSIDDPTWNISGDLCVLMIDEESMNHYSWAGGDHNAFLGYLNQGIMLAAGPNKKVFWYGQPISWAFNDLRWNKRANGWGWSDATIQGFFNVSNIQFRSPGWLASKWFIDRPGGYLKVPSLSGKSIYKRDGGGNFIIDANGFREYIDTDFTTNHYGSLVTIYHTPHDYIKWAGTKTGGVPFYGWQSEWGAYDSVEMTHALPGGWDWYPFARPARADWKPETFLYVDGMYTYADGMVTGFMQLNQIERGTWAASQRLALYKQYQETRVVGEPYTADTNAIEVRQLGIEAIFSTTVMFAYSGGLAFSTWDDGGPLIPRPNKPGQLWGTSKNYGAYQTRLAALHEAYEELQGTDPGSWKFVNFYYPLKGHTDFETIAMGIYHGTRFYFCALNPSLEDGETMALELCTGPSIFNVSITGHDFYLGNFTVPSGLNVEDFTLEYETIYGLHKKVNGALTGDFTDHYE